MTRLASMKPKMTVMWAMVTFPEFGDADAGGVELECCAHVRHYIQHAIGVCYIGGKDDRGRDADTRTPEQKAALWFLLKDLKQAYPQAKIVGHRDFPRVSKRCPLFDVQKEYATLNS